LNSGVDPMIDDNSSFMGHASLGDASKKIRAFHRLNEARSDLKIRSRMKRMNVIGHTLNVKWYTNPKMGF